MSHQIMNKGSNDKPNVADQGQLVLDDNSAVGKVKPLSAGKPTIPDVNVNLGGLAIDESASSKSAPPKTMSRPTIPDTDISSADLGGLAIDTSSDPLPVPRQALADDITRVDRPSAVAPAAVAREAVASEPVTTEPALPEPVPTGAVEPEAAAKPDVKQDAPEKEASAAPTGPLKISGPASSNEAPPVPVALNKGQGGPPGRKRIGEHLVSINLLTEDQLNVALQEKRATGKMIGQVLIDLGFLNENTFIRVLADLNGYEVFDSKTTIVDADALKYIDKETAKKHSFLPVAINESEVQVAMLDAQDVMAMDMLRRFLPKHLLIKPMLATPASLSDAIDAAYGYASSIPDILKELEAGGDVDIAGLDEDDAYTHPIVRLVNALVFDAVKMGASDIHFEPEANFVRLRYRVDGVLFTSQILHKQYWNGISQRIKIISNMNIADKLSPQDGRFGLNIGGREADFRVSSLPTVHGENIVLRILDQSASIMPLEKLGFSPHNMARLKRAQSRPEGIIIVTGPTGSGKSTSLYSMLNAINNVEINIQTLEDPVEYSLPMIRQTYVREGVLEFADGIKALLRQDPDIIFIGEIRDKTTAEMALKAAMTGHQVYTTLHTNDSFGVIPRLFDLGLKPGMVAGAIVAAFAQRLVRRLCPHCKEEYVPDETECRILYADPANPPVIYKAHQGGCHSCKGQGYKGRIGVVEILLFDDDIDALVAKSASKSEIKAEAEKKGFKTMKEDAILKILEGVTSFEAAARVVDIYG